MSWNCGNPDILPVIRLEAVHSLLQLTIFLITCFQPETNNYSNNSTAQTSWKFYCKSYWTYANAPIPLNTTLYDNSANLWQCQVHLTLQTLVASTKIYPVFESGFLALIRIQGSAGSLPKCSGFSPRLVSFILPRKEASDCIRNANKSPEMQ